MWATRILELQNALVAARQVTAKLAAQLETPATEDRWMALPGDDPDSEQLQLRVKELEDRLNGARKDLLERDLVLEELTGLAARLSDELHGAAPDAATTAAAALAKQSNDLQARVRESTRKLMALVSEMSMYQATAIKLSAEAEAGEAAVAAGQRNLAAGLPPSLAAEQRWSLLERQLGGGGRGGGAGAAAAGAGDGDGDGGARPDPRPNAYIPADGVGLPKPYLHYAPFKPSEPGASMRHFRAPEPKPVEI